MYGSSSSRMDDNGIKCATGRQTRKEAVGYVVRQSRAASPLRRAWMKAHRSSLAPITKADCNLCVAYRMIRYLMGDNQIPVGDEGNRNNTDGP